MYQRNGSRGGAPGTSLYPEKNRRKSVKNRMKRDHSFIYQCVVTGVIIMSMAVKAAAVVDKVTGKPNYGKKEKAEETPLMAQTDA